MFIELVGSLRCLGEHEPTWLVAAIDRLEGRAIVEGSLGCPACGRRYPVTRGEADFRSPGAFAASLPGTAETPAGAPSADEILRARAQLGLDEGGGTVALTEGAARFAVGLRGDVAAEILLINPDHSWRQGSPSVLLVSDVVPLAPGSLRGAMIGEGVGTVWPSALVRALRDRGRLVAPRKFPVPNGTRLVARDDREWVAERVADGLPVFVPMTGRGSREA
jgi:hypothetical protein